MFPFLYVHIYGNVKTSRNRKLYMFRGISFSSKAKFIQNTRTLFRKQAEYRKGTVLWGQRRGCIILRKNEKSYSCLPKTKVTFSGDLKFKTSILFSFWHDIISFFVLLVLRIQWYIKTILYFHSSPAWLYNVNDIVRNMRFLMLKKKTVP